MEDWGDLIICTDEPGDFELFIETRELKTCQAKGLPLDSQIRAAIKNFAVEEARRIRDAVRQAGVSDTIKRFLNAESKKEVRSLVKEITLKYDDLIDFVSNCNQLGFEHSRKITESIPQDLIPTVQERQAFETNGVGVLRTKSAQKFVSKLFGIHTRRKFIVARLFKRASEWHLFYYDRHEIAAPRGVNHYKDGPHIHYISHLFGSKISLPKIWSSFEQGGCIGGSEHIRVDLCGRIPSWVKFHRGTWSST